MPAPLAIIPASHAWLISRLHERGFYVAGIYIGETFASLESREQFATFYQHLREKYKLPPQAGLVAQSRGELNHYNLATNHPHGVNCIEGIYTGCDMRSDPSVERAAPAYGLPPQQLNAQISQHPIDRLAPLASAQIPIRHIHGNTDKVVPLEADSAAWLKNTKRSGGEMELGLVPGRGHEFDPGFFGSEKMLIFILTHGLGD